MSTLYPICTGHVETVSYMPRSDSTHFYSIAHVQSIHHLLSKFFQFITLLLMSSQNTTSSAHGQAHGQSVHHLLLSEYHLSPTEHNHLCWVDPPPFFLLPVFFIHRIVILVVLILAELELAIDTAWVFAIAINCVHIKPSAFQ